MAFNVRCRSCGGPFNKRGTCDCWKANVSENLVAIREPEVREVDMRILALRSECRRCRHVTQSVPGTQGQVRECRRCGHKEAQKCLRS